MAAFLPGKFLYLATPRTGSTAVCVALREFGARSVHGGQHVGIDQVKNYNGEFTFTAVRNPYDMVASWYHMMKVAKGIVADMSMAEFVRTYEVHDFVRDGTLFYHCTEGVHVMRWETLQRDFEEVLEHLGLPIISLPRKNMTSNKRPWLEYFDTEALTAMNERFGHDIDRFGYSRMESREGIEPSSSD